jgi:YggT family protein
MNNHDVAEFVGNLFTVYLIVLLVAILITWIPRMPYNRALNAFVTFVHDSADPYLRIFRSFIKPIGSGAVAFDLSPIIAIIVLGIVGNIIVSAIDRI